MNTSTSVSPLSATETELLSFLLDHAVKNESAIALWRLPNNSAHHAIIAQEHQLLAPDAALEELPCGFIFAKAGKDSERIFLGADATFSFENENLKTSEDPLGVKSLNWLREMFRKPEEKNKLRVGRHIADTTDPDKSGFVTLVKKCITEIENGTLEKIVPSHTRLITLPESFDIVTAFQKLCKTYPNALVSFIHVPGIGSWMGASPETLVTVEDKTIFKTVALAGTKAYDEGTNLKNVAWTQKEIEEQALVERYIISCFKKIRIREYDEHGPKTVVAGNLMHLRSDFSVDMKATNFPQLGTVMLNLLHPTSAVCGMPLEAAADFLKKNEGYAREFYSGYLGPVNFNGNINLFVNLRCMQLLEDKALLYAGAGVTIDSVPEAEWEETEMKFNTLLNVITKS